MKLKVFGKDGVYLEIDVKKFEAASSSGKYEIMKGHAPFVADVVPCVVKYEFDEKVGRFFTTAGVVEYDGENINMWVVDYITDIDEFERALEKVADEWKPIARAVLEEEGQAS